MPCRRATWARPAVAALSPLAWAVVGAAPAAASTLEAQVSGGAVPTRVKRVGWVL